MIENKDDFHSGNYFLFEKREEFTTGVSDIVDV